MGSVLSSQTQLGQMGGEVNHAREHPLQTLRPASRMLLTAGAHGWRNAAARNERQLVIVQFARLVIVMIVMVLVLVIQHG